MTKSSKKIAKTFHRRFWFTLALLTLIFSLRILYRRDFINFVLVLEHLIKDRERNGPDKSLVLSELIFLDGYPVLVRKQFSYWKFLWKLFLCNKYFAIFHDKNVSLNRRSFREQKNCFKYQFLLDKSHQCYNVEFLRLFFIYAWLDNVHRKMESVDRNWDWTSNIYNHGGTVVCQRNRFIASLNTHFLFGHRIARTITMCACDKTCPPIYFTITSITTWTVRGREGTPKPTNNISLSGFVGVSPQLLRFS